MACLDFADSGTGSWPSCEDPCCGNPAASWLLGDPWEVGRAQPFDVVAAAACRGEATSFSCPVALQDHPCTCQDAFRTAAAPSCPDACPA